MTLTALKTGGIAAVLALCLAAPGLAQTDIADLRTAAESGGAPEAFDYGYALTFPETGDADFETGRFWLARAADAGSREARYILGLVYADGLGVDSDLHRARAFFEPAWQQGHAAAGFALAEMLVYGFPEEAASGLEILATLAADPVHAGHAELVSAEARLFGPEAIIDEDAAIAHAQAALAADPDRAGAHYILGIGLMEGFAGTPDPRGARAAWQRGAEAGDGLAMTALAYALENGQGGAADPVEALALLQAAAVLGDIDAAREAARLEETLDDDQIAAAAARADAWLARL